MQIPVTVVVAVGERGRAVVPTIRSVAAAAADEVIVIAGHDEVERVKAWVDAAGVSARVIGSGERIAAQRNAGIALARNRMVAIVDAGALVEREWLDSVGHSDGDDRVVRPELCVTFDRHLAVWNQSTSIEDAAEVLPVIMPWAPVFAASRALLARLPFPDLDDAVVDDAWHASLSAADVRQRVLPATAVFWRVLESAAPWSRPDGVTLPYAPPSRFAPRARRKPAVNSRFLRFVRGVVRYLVRPWERLLHIVRARFAPQQAVPSWLTPLFATMHEFEPLVPYPNGRFYDRFVVVGPPWPAETRRLGQDFHRLRAAFPAQVDYIYLAPWLRMGGGDNVLLRFIEAVKRAKPSARVALITTEDVPSTRLHALPPEVGVVELRDFFDVKGARDLLAGRVLPQLIASLNPRVVHAFNSTLAFDVVERHPYSIDAAIFLSTFAIDRTSFGEQTSAMFHRTPDFLESVDAVFVDSERFADRMSAEHGFDRAKFVVQRHVIADARRVDRGHIFFTPARPLRLLWIGRFDLPKRLDVLARVAEALNHGGLPVVVEFYGDEVMGYEGLPQVLDRLATAGAIQHPAFDGFASLPVERFDGYIMTSEWEGIPNSLLEAMSVGLPVIAPNVGGIAEVLDTDTGYLIEDFQDIDAYEQAVRFMLDDYADALRRGDNARRLVAERFSQEAFDSRLRLVGDYLSSSS